MILKNFYDKNVPTRNLVTTISGVVTLLITILVGFGVIKPENQGDLQTHAATLINSGVAIWGAITAIILMFKAKD
jgi:hypothetical protein